MTTDNYRKHTSKNPLQQYLINRFYDTLLAEIKKLNPSTIFDAGCGEGFTLEKLRLEGIGAEMEGMDMEERAIEIGKSRYPHITFVQGSIYKMPYVDNAFDLVICTEVLEHLESPENALAELHRVTQKYCVVSVPNEPYFRLANFMRGKNISRWGNGIEHIQNWSSRGIVKILEKYFTVVVVKTPFPWTLVVLKK